MLVDNDNRLRLGLFAGVVALTAACSGPATPPVTPANPPPPRTSEPPPPTTTSSADPKPRVIGRQGIITRLAVDGDYVRLGMRFPEQVGPFQRVAISDYNSRAYGHSVAYRSASGLVVSVFVYGTGGNIGREAASVRGAIVRRNQAVVFYIDGPAKQRVSGRDVPAYVLVGQWANRKMTTKAVVFVVGGYFVKYRITGTSHSFVTDHKALIHLVDMLGGPTS